MWMEENFSINAMEVMEVRFRVDLHLRNKLTEVSDLCIPNCRFYVYYKKKNDHCFV